MSLKWTGRLFISFGHYVKLRYNSHHIKFHILMCSRQWFLIFFTVLHNHYHCRILECSHPCKKKPWSYKLLIPISLSPILWHPLIYFLSWWICLLDICKWHHATCGLLCLASLTEHNVFKVPPCCSMCQFFIPFYSQRIFHCRDIPHSLIDGPLSCFCFLAITYNAALNILVWASLWTCVWSSWVYTYE